MRSVFPRAAEGGNIMDRWLWSVYEDSGRLECPVCESIWEISYPYTAADYRHCPKCGERLEPPKEE